MLKYVEKKYQSSEHKLSFNRFISSPTLFENHSRWHLSRDIFQFPTRSLLRAYTFPPTWMHWKCRWSIIRPLGHQGKPPFSGLSCKFASYLDAPKAVQVKYNCLVSKGKRKGHHLVSVSHQSGQELLARTSGSWICWTSLFVIFFVVKSSDGTFSIGTSRSTGEKIEVNKRRGKKLFFYLKNSFFFIIFQ